MNRDQFYKKELIDRDRHIEELKQALDIAEMKLKRSDEVKKELNNKLKDLNERVKGLSLY
jgi:hypothetical protein